jgi:DNA-directed RNA polymerase specialized sigma subunit
VERQLTNVFYPSAALLLFGELVPGELAVLGLRGRVVLYCLLVEQMERAEVQELLGVSEWCVKRCIASAMEALHV